MTMRKTRQQSRLETRQRLLAAAQAAIVRGGIGAVTLRGVCEEAGFSQGAFYSNFASRDELLLAVMTAHLHDEVETLKRIIQSMQGKALQAVLSTLATRLDALAQDTQWSLLTIELQLHARRDAGFAAIHDDAKANYHEEFARLVEAIVRGHGLEPIMPSLQIAIGLYALWSGLVFQSAVSGAWPRDRIFLAFIGAAIGANLTQQHRTSAVSARAGVRGRASR